MKTRLVVFTTLLLLSTGAFAQQDPLYSQYNFNKLAFNPAYAGIYDMASVTTMYRDQWAGLEGSPKTFTLSGNTSLPLDKAGAGITVINDNAGAISNTEVDIAFAYRLVSPSGDNKFSMGLNVGLINQRVDYNSLNLEDNTDPNFQGSSSITKPNVGFGLYYTTPQYFAGISVPKILNVDFDNGDVTGTTYERHYYLNAGYLLELANKDIKLVPSFWLKYVDGADPSVDLNLTGIFSETIWAGLGMRNTSALFISGQLQVSDLVKLGVAYELSFKDNLSRYPTLEFMVNFGFPLFDFHAVQPVYF